GRRVGPVRPRRTRPEQRRRLRGVAPPLPARGTGGRKTNSVPSTASVPVGELTGIVGQDPDVGAVAHGFDGITVEDRPSATTYSRTPPPTSTIVARRGGWSGASCGPVRSGLRGRAEATRQAARPGQRDREADRADRADARRPAPPV